MRPPKFAKLSVGSRSFNNRITYCLRNDCERDWPTHRLESQFYRNYDKDITKRCMHRAGVARDNRERNCVFSHLRERGKMINNFLLSFLLRKWASSVMRKNFSFSLYSPFDRTANFHPVGMHRRTFTCKRGQMKRGNGSLWLAGDSAGFQLLPRRWN